MFTIIALVSMLLYPLMIAAVLALPIYYLVLRARARREFRRQVAEREREAAEREAAAKRRRERIAAEEARERARKAELARIEEELREESPYAYLYR